jgi:hypothetical protein
MFIFNGLRKDTAAHHAPDCGITRADITARPMTPSFHSKKDSLDGQEGLHSFCATRVKVELFFAAITRKAPVERAR